MKKLKFKSPGQWNTFAYYIQNQNRYILNKELEKFAKNIVYTAKKRKKELKKGALFYRARIGYQKKRSKNSIHENKYPLAKKEMLKPPRERAVEGRINPTGISYFYLSSNKLTAISETKPWIGHFVSVATCEITSKIKVVDVRSDLDFLDVCLPWEKRKSSKQKEERIWWDIDKAFAKPIVEHKVNVDYAATQYLSELFKNAGFKGIIYKSSLSEDGYNLSLFDFWHGWDITIKRIELFQVSSLKYSAEKYKNPT